MVCINLFPFFAEICSWRVDQRPALLALRPWSRLRWLREQYYATAICIILFPAGSWRPTARWWTRSLRGVNAGCGRCRLRRLPVHHLRRDCSPQAVAAKVATVQPSPCANSTEPRKRAPEPEIRWRVLTAISFFQEQSHATRQPFRARTLPYYARAPLSRTTLVVVRNSSITGTSTFVINRILVVHRTSSTASSIQSVRDRGQQGQCATKSVRTGFRFGATRDHLPGE